MVLLLRETYLMLWFGKSKKSWKIGLPLLQRTFGPGGSGEPPGHFNFAGFTDSAHPHNQETRSLNTIQACYFFPFLGGYFSSIKIMLRQREIWITKIIRNHRPGKAYQWLYQSSLEIILSLYHFSVKWNSFQFIFSLNDIHVQVRR